MRGTLDEFAMNFGNSISLDKQRTGFLGSSEIVSSTSTMSSSDLDDFRRPFIPLFRLLILQLVSFFY